MNTLIIPCAGRSTRFPNLRPKWMLYYPDGKMMVEKAIEGLELDGFDRIIFTIVREHAIKYKADSILSEIFGITSTTKYELCILEDFTSCQSETVFQTLIKCNVEGKFSVKDSDNFIAVDTKNLDDYIAGLNITTFPKEIERLAGKSFLILNSQGIVTDIIEKKIKSEYICVGLYGFSDSEKFIEAYKHLRDVSDKKYEIYLSHVISYLIGTKKSVYKYIDIDGYEDWGTLQDWDTMLSAKKTIIINIDDILIKRMENYGDDSWKGSLVSIEENIDAIKKVSDEGAQLILLSSIPNQYRDRLVDVLASHNVDYYELITGCRLAPEYLIKSRDNTVCWPDVYSASIRNGERLGDYL